MRSACAAIWRCWAIVARKSRTWRWTPVGDAAEANRNHRHERRHRMFAGMPHVQLDAAGEARQGAVETRQGGRHVGVGRNVAERLPDELIGIDFEHAPRGVVGARDGPGGVEGDHRVGVVIEDRAEALFVALDTAPALRGAP